MNGKVLKVKIGYNPNSSSIGTAVSVFVWGAAIVSLAGASLAGIVASIRRQPHTSIDTVKEGEDRGAPTRAGGK